MRTLHADDDEMSGIAGDEGLQVLHPGYGTRPRIYRKYLDRFYKAFVGGTLVGELAGVTERIADARLTLKRGAQALGETTCDAYGDFKFQGIEEYSGAYRLEIADRRFKAKAVEFDLKESVCLGTVVLEKALTGRALRGWE
jgi:hypothetical protein